MDENRIQMNDSLKSTVSRVLEEMKAECRAAGRQFRLEDVNLSEFQRRCGISRQRARTIRRNGFRVLPHGNAGRRRKTVLDGFTGVVDAKLASGTTNSVSILKALRDAGYTGGQTAVKEYVASHRFLVPAPRAAVEPQGNRCRRFESGPGECYEMDWGFVNVEDNAGEQWRCACFVMVCHHCGLRYIEFFPNARQENLFIGMLHAFGVMGLPRKVLTDHMKSVVLHMDADGRPVWNANYGRFMEVVGFETRLCKVAHPWTKGACERLVRYMKDNFVQGRRFADVGELNGEALRWCHEANSRPHPEHGCVPLATHFGKEGMTSMPLGNEHLPFLAPMRSVEFDGYVSYEGRRYGVPLSAGRKPVLVLRDKEILSILSPETYEVLVRHRVEWSSRVNPCEGQWSEYGDQPEDLPTAPVKVAMRQESILADPVFAKFGFSGQEVRNE